MANTILTPTAVTREALRILHQKLTFVGRVNRQYDDSFANSGAKIGDSLKIRLPNQYTIRTGATLSTQDVTETSVTLQIATQKGVDVTFSSAELTLSLDDFSSRILEPAMSVLAANVEADALSMRKDVYQQVNNTGAAITLGKVLTGRRLMQDQLAPLDNNRTALMNTLDTSDIVDSLKGLFHDDAQLAKQYREARMGRAASYDWYETSLFAKQTRGAGTATYVTNGAQPSASSVTLATGTGTIKQGEIVTFTGIFSVHPETKVSTGNLQQFAVTADYAGGAGVLSFTPAVSATGATQNVNIVIPTATAMQIAGTISTDYGQSLLFHRDAFVFATADLQMPKGVDFAAREVFDGLSLRIVRQYAISTDTFPCRIDILYGYKTVRAQLAARLANN